MGHIGEEFVSSDRTVPMTAAANQLNIWKTTHEALQHRIQFKLKAVEFQLQVALKFLPKLPSI